MLLPKKGNEPGSLPTSQGETTKKVSSKTTGEKKSTGGEGKSS